MDKILNWEEKFFLRVSEWECPCKGKVFVEETVMCKASGADFLAILWSYLHSENLTFSLLLYGLFTSECVSCLSSSEL